MTNKQDSIVHCKQLNICKDQYHCFTSTIFCMVMHSYHLFLLSKILLFERHKSKIVEVNNKCYRHLSNQCIVFKWIYRDEAQRRRANNNNDNKGGEQTTSVYKLRRSSSVLWRKYEQEIQFEMAHFSCGEEIFVQILFSRWYVQGMFLGISLLLT